MPVSADASAHQPVGYEGPRRTLLIADDKPYNLMLLVHWLEPLGFQIAAVSDGQSLVEKALALHPDAIIADVLMPVKTGLEAVWELRQYLEFAETPIIAISASITGVDRERCYSAGCNGFLSKPVRARDLFSMLEMQLNLAWRYPDECPAEDETAAPQPQPLVLPVEEIQELYELARIGNIFAIEERLHELEGLGGPYLPFIRSLQQLAHDFQVRALVSLLEQHLGKE
jgi:CheY-like chemotaxis protein